MYQNYKVVVNTAAGRRRYMQYLIPYVISSEIVDRYDLWINTHNCADIEFFKQLASLYSKINLVWQPDGWVNGNASINAFYKQCCDENTIYFKLDDDIVWMEDGAIEKMIKFRVENPQYFLVSPLVINNAQSTYLLQVCGKLKLNKYYNSAADNNILWRSGEFASQLHQWFLKKLNNKSFNDLHLGSHPMALCRFSINAIMWFGKDLAKIKGIVPGDDEEFMSCILPSKMGGTNCWNGDVILAHFAFYTQREQLDKCSILEKYGKINFERFKENKVLAEVNERVQEIMRDIKGIESQLMQNPSPYSNVNPNVPARKDERNVIKKIIPTPIKKFAKLILKNSNNEIEKYILS